MYIIIMGYLVDTVADVISHAAHNSGHVVR